MLFVSFLVNTVNRASFIESQSLVGPLRPVSTVVCPMHASMPLPLLPSLPWAGPAMSYVVVLVAFSIQEKRTEPEHHEGRRLLFQADNMIEQRVSPELKNVADVGQAGTAGNLGVPDLMKPTDT